MSRFRYIDDEISRNLEYLDKGMLYELDNKRGIPKCSTIANKLQDSFEKLSDAYEGLISEQAEAAEEEYFDVLYSMLDSIINEVNLLKVKYIDKPLNINKVSSINKVLCQLKEILENEQAGSFLVLITEEADPNKRTEGQNNSYSDVALLLSQYKTACALYKHKYYKHGF